MVLPPCPQQTLVIRQLVDQAISYPSSPPDRRAQADLRLALLDNTTTSSLGRKRSTGVANQIDLSGRVLCIPRVELDHALDLTVGRRGDEQWVLDDVPGNTLVAGRCCQGTLVLPDGGGGDVFLESREVDGGGFDGGACLTGSVEVGEDGADECGGDLHCCDFDHLTDYGEGLVYQERGRVSQDKHIGW